MYYFLCKLITDLHSLFHFITGLNHMHKSSVQFGKKNRRFGSGSAKIPGSVVSEFADIYIVTILLNLDVNR